MLRLMCYIDLIFMKGLGFFLKLELRYKILKAIVDFFPRLLPIVITKSMPFIVLDRGRCIYCSAVENTASML